jgi:hypothetical protein
MTKTDPFFEVNYKKEWGVCGPIIDIEVGDAEKKLISGYTDTGCTTGIFLFKSQIAKMGLDLGSKINEDPSPCEMADGHRIGADEYITIARFNGEEKEITITVIDPECKMDPVAPSECAPLIGRGFLDYFDVLFKGKERKVCFFKI